MTHTSRELREWAARCADMATSAESAEEQDHLQKKAAALRALADTEDWLEGRRPETSAMPPQNHVSRDRQAAE